MTLCQLIWKRTKCECPQSKKKKKTQRNKERKELSWGLSKHNTSFFEITELRIYNTIEVTALNRGDRTITACLYVDFIPTPAGGTKISPCWMVTLGSLEQLAWYFPTGLCFLGSGTGLGLRTYPLESSHRHQSSAHLLAPVGTEDMTWRQSENKWSWGLTISDNTWNTIKFLQY